MFEEIMPHKIEKEVLIDEIETIIEHMKISYIDAIVLYCETNDLEIESVASILKNNEKIVNKLKQDYEELNFLPKESRLPI